MTVTADFRAIDDSVVYRKSGQGAAQLATTRGGALSLRERQVLILLDGRRTIAELAELFGTDETCRLVARLEDKGFAKQVAPELPAEWAEAVTQFRFDTPAEEPSKPAHEWHRDWFALVNLGMLVLVLAMAAGLWASTQRPSDVTLPLGAAPGRAWHGEVSRPPGSADEIDSRETGFVATGPIMPLSHLLTVKGSKSASGASQAHAEHQAMQDSR